MESNCLSSPHNSGNDVVSSSDLLEAGVELDANMCMFQICVENMLGTGSRRCFGCDIADAPCNLDRNRT